jgi:peptidoglycan hydrolase-like protein with peptidoglycan-binding domain
LLGRYKKAAGADAKKADAEGDYARGNKRFSGIVKATKKQFANDEKGVAEAGSNAMTDTAKRLADKDDGKVAKLRAAGDKRREEELKGRNIAKRNDEDFEIVENDKPNDPIVRQIQQMLNDKFGANLDIDGYLGPLTKKSIKKFLPAAKTGSAPKPGLPTAVQPISESVDPKVSIVFDKYNPPDKDSIDGWKVAAKTKYWMVGTNKVKKDPKNPLPHEVKLVCLETAMPRINEHLEIVDDWLALAVKAYKKYGDIELVVCTRHDSIFKEILKANDHKGKHGYFKFDKITKVATPYYRHDKELKQALINKDKTAFKRSSGVSPDKRIVAEHKRYEYFDLLEKFMIKRIPIVSLNESKFLPLNESIESQMENLIKRLENK